jgi:hypothetical protein
MRRQRLLKTSSPYEGYVAWVYRTNPGLSEQPSAVQQSTLLRSGFGWGDGWKYYLEQTGAFEVQDVVVNAPAARHAWAKERGVTNATTTPEDFAERLVAEFRPDIWFCHTHEFTPEFMKRILRRYKGIRLVIGYDGVRKHDVNFFRECHLVLTCLEETADFYAAAGLDSFLFRHSFDDRILAFLKPSASTYDVSFVGGVQLSRLGHNLRIDVLRRVAACLPLELFLSDRPSVQSALLVATGYLRRGQALRLGSHLRRFVALRMLARSSRQGVFGIAMYEALARSRTTLNIHIDVAGREAANIRLFEATGVGTCLVTDWKDTLPKLFRPEDEVVTFRTADEAVDKLRYLLAHEATRASIARRGQARTLTTHRLQDRLRELLPILGVIGSP